MMQPSVLHIRYSWPYINQTIKEKLISMTNSYTRLLYSRKVRWVESLASCLLRVHQLKSSKLVVTINNSLADLFICSAKFLKRVKFIKHSRQTFPLYTITPSYITAIWFDFDPIFTTTLTSYKSWASFTANPSSTPLSSLCPYNTCTAISYLYHTYIPNPFLLAEEISAVFWNDH